MPSPPDRLPLPPLAPWLRVLGAGVCLLPLLALPVGLALDAGSPEEYLGSLLFLVVVYGLGFLVVSVPLLWPLVCWCLGWRPGTVAGGVVLSLSGVGRLLDGGEFDRWQGGLLLLHLPLLGLQLWEWRRAARRRREELARRADQASR